MPNIEASCSADSMATCMVSSPGLGLGTPTTIPLGDEEGRVGRMEGWGEGEGEGKGKGNMGAGERRGEGKGGGEEERKKREDGWC